MPWISYTPSTTTPVGERCGVAIGYLVFIIYLFIGIAFASDLFMNAIERICGATRTVKIVKEEDGVIVTNTKNIPVWNETIANLSLMALGSSAPEILLSVIEICEGLGTDNPGELGPGTIVGSAAYNLMMITGVCILSVKDGRTSRIKMYKVFGVTAMTSLFAYIWMVVVLQWISPDIVEIWEAVLTFLFFPILVVVSYWAHHDFCIPEEGQIRRPSVASGGSGESGEDRGFYFGGEEDNLYDSDGNVDKAALKALYNRLTEIADLTPDEISNIIATKLIQGKQHTRMWYRSQMTRALMGGAKLLPVLNEKLKEVAQAIDKEDDQVMQKRPSVLKAAITSADTQVNKAVVEFQAATIAVPEGIGTFNVDIFRIGKDDVGFKVKVESVDGTAKKTKEYEPISQLISFDPYVKEGKVAVKIFDNVQWNPDSNFYLKLTIPAEFEGKVKTGQARVLEIIIQDDDKPGKLSFLKRGYVFKSTQKVAHVEVVRSSGTDGIISVDWKIIPFPNCTLVKELTGKLEFQHKEMKKFIQIPIKVQQEDTTIEGEQETFDVELSSPTGGARLGKIKRTTCAITSDENFKLEINDVLTAALQISEAADEEQSYKDQVIDSFKVNGGDIENASVNDWILHCLTFPYKVTLALIPPTQIWGGWITFVLALCAVGFLTKIVGEAARAFGDACGLDPVITAITVVALGTSLPDTFASRISAMNDKHADNAVGNVTGSNSVNVFLGLGIPWVIGAVYYAINGNSGVTPKPDKLGHEFCVPAESLTFNVLVYTMCAATTIGILTYRRYSDACGKAELGGPDKPRWSTAITMMMLWFLYILLSSLQVILSGQGNDISEALRGNTKETPCFTRVKAARNASKHN